MKKEEKYLKIEFTKVDPDVNVDLEPTIINVPSNNYSEYYIHVIEKDDNVEIKLIKV